LWWDGPGEEPDLNLLWRAYIRRFDLEHTFRFLKQTLGWHAREAAETLREVARKAKRPPFWPGQALPGPQKGRLSPRRPRTRSIAMSFMSIAILLMLKMQAKENLSAF